MSVSQRGTDIVLEVAEDIFIEIKTMDSKLFWENLKENRCARCAAPLEISLQTGMHWCKTPGCEFRTMFPPGQGYHFETVGTSTSESLGYSDCTKIQ